MKRQHSEWEKTFANKAYDKELISKILKQFMQLNTKKTKQANQKWAENPNRHFSIEYIKIANRNMKRCSTSLNIIEMRIKTTLRCHVTPVRVSIIKKSTNNKGWRGCGEKGTS